MKKFFQQKFFPLFFCFLFFFSGFSFPAKGEEEITISNISLDAGITIHPDAFNHPSSLVLGLESLAKRLRFSASGVVTSLYQADLAFAVKDGGNPLFSGHVYGNTFGYDIISDLFDNASILADFPQYLPFLQKAYDYFFAFGDVNFPFNYIGLLTDVYSFQYGIKPTLAALKNLFSGTSERYYTPEEVVSELTDFQSLLLENGSFLTYLQSFLHPMGLDYLADNFFNYDLPDWAETIAQEGLSINTYPGYEIWSAGSHVILQKEELDGNYIISLSLPPYEGYSFTIEYLLIKTDQGYRLSGSASLVYEEEGAEKDEVLFLSLEGDTSFDAQNNFSQQNATITLAGSSVDLPWTLALSAPRYTKTQGDTTIYDGSFSLLNLTTKQPMVTLDYLYQTSPYQGDGFPDKSVHSNGPQIPLFTVNDRDDSLILLKERIVLPAVKKLKAFILGLPTSVAVPLMQWGVEQGLFAMIFSSD